jgi:hypothetical protein
MNRDEALHIISDEVLFKKLLEINSGRLEKTETYATSLDLLSETEVDQLAGTYFDTHRYRSCNFLFFKNSYDYFLLLDPSVLEKLQFFLGSCILSCRLHRTISTADLKVYQDAMGQDLFSFSYFYAVFAAYADELQITEKIKSLDITSDNIEELIRKCGDVALYRMIQKFSSERIRVLFLKKITLTDFYELSTYFGISPVKSSYGAVRLYRLAGIFLHNIGIDVAVMQK